jgi:hypothetical protein
VLGILGVGLIALLPLNRSAAAREQADIQRARVRLVSVFLDELRGGPEHRLDVTIPMDAQWQRIAKRLGPPAFVIVAATSPDDTDRHTLSPASVGLVIQLWRNGLGVELEPSSETPFPYSSFSTNNGLKFVADPGDRISMVARVTAHDIPPRSVLLLVPNWHFEAWAEGAPFSAIFLHGVSLVAFVAGLACLWASAAVALGRLAA